MVYIHSFTFFNFGRPPSRRSVVLGDELARVGRRQRRRTGCFEGDDLASLGAERRVSLDQVLRKVGERPPNQNMKNMQG